MTRCSGSIAGLLLVVLCADGAVAAMRAPRQSVAEVNWHEAVAALPSDGALAGSRTAALRLRTSRSRTAAVPAPLTRLNTIMAQRLPGLSLSPVPVLLPYDLPALLHDQAAGQKPDDERYLAGFHAPTFFHAGPSGYDAAFAVKPGEIAELADSKYRGTIDVQISASVLLYEIEPPVGAEAHPVGALDHLFPGIRKLILEHNLRYTFVRFGVPYVVSITCFDAGKPRYHLPTCRTADVVAQRFLRALQMVGGLPRNLHATAALPIEQPAARSRVFSYYPPGELLPRTSVRDRGGSADDTVYSQIRFPLGAAPAIAASEVYQRRSRAWEAQGQANPALVAEIRWRDNFCERRGFPVGQCPAGNGHQGQDIRPAPCTPAPGEEHCGSQADVVAARDGVIMRSPKREAAYLVVNTATEHIRFRYLHMSPAKMDASGLLSGRRVYEGEVIGQVSNFDGRGNGTSYHLHFDIQVPTRDGWVFVNPYMTLVSAYERLIGARGTELSDAGARVSDPSAAGAVVDPPHADPEKRLPSRAARHSPRKSQGHRQHVAGQ